MNSRALDAGDVADLVKLQDSLKSGLLAKSGVSAETVDSLVALQKSLEDAGLDRKAVVDLLSEVTGGDLSEEAAADLMNKVLDSAGVDKELFEDVLAVQEALAKGDLKGKSVSFFKTL